MPCLTFKKICNNLRHIEQLLVVEKCGKETWWLEPKTSQIQRIIYKLVSHSWLPVTTIVKKYGTNYDFFIICELFVETMKLQIPMKT